MKVKLLIAVPGRPMKLIIILEEDVKLGIEIVVVPPKLNVTNVRVSSTQQIA